MENLLLSSQGLPAIFAAALYFSYIYINNNPPWSSSSTCSPPIVLPLYIRYARSSGYGDGGKMKIFLKRRKNSTGDVYTGCIHDIYVCCVCDAAAAVASAVKLLLNWIRPHPTIWFNSRSDAPNRAPPGWLIYSSSGIYIYVYTHCIQGERE